MSVSLLNRTAPAPGKGASPMYPTTVSPATPSSRLTRAAFLRRQMPHLMSDPVTVVGAPRLAAGAGSTAAQLCQRHVAVAVAVAVPIPTLRPVRAPDLSLPARDASATRIATPRPHPDREHQLFLGPTPRRPRLPARGAVKRVGAALQAGGVGGGRRCARRVVVVDAASRALQGALPGRCCVRSAEIRRVFTPDHR